MNTDMVDFMLSFVDMLLTESSYSRQDHSILALSSDDFSFTQIGIFDGVVWLCLSAGTYDKTCLQNGSGK